MNLRQIELIESVIDAGDSPEQANFHAKVATLITILLVAYLRGHEGFYLDIAGTRKHYDGGCNFVVSAKVLKNKLVLADKAKSLPQVCICLLGKFKRNLVNLVTLSLWQTNHCLVWSLHIGKLGV